MLHTGFASPEHYELPPFVLIQNIDVSFRDYTMKRFKEDNGNEIYFPLLRKFRRAIRHGSSVRLRIRADEDKPQMYPNASTVLDFICDKFMPFYEGIPLHFSFNIDCTSEVSYSTMINKLIVRIIKKAKHFLTKFSLAISLNFAFLFYIKIQIRAQFSFVSFIEQGFNSNYNDIMHKILR